jgi:membrane protease YdiL (CAAX protease family)
MSSAISEPSKSGRQLPGLHQDDSRSPAVPGVPWSPALAVLFVVFVYFASQIIAGLVVSLYPLSRGWAHTRAVDWINNSIGAQFAYILMAEALVVGSVYGFLRFYKQTLSLIGLKRPRWQDPFYGLAALPVYFILYLLSVSVITHFVPSLNVNEQQQLGFNNVSGTLPLILTFISLVILPPLAEEIMVRGFLYSSLKKTMPTVGAVVATSAIFAVAHLPEGGSAGPLYIAAVDTFVLSLVLIYLREKTGSLWPSITLHALKNGIAFVALFVFHAH